MALVSGNESQSLQWQSINPQDEQVIQVSVTLVTLKGLGECLAGNVLAKYILTTRDAPTKRD